MTRWLIFLLPVLLCRTTLGSVVHWDHAEATPHQHHDQEPPALVSIMMPVYERPALLELALEQIGKASYSGNLEVIVMDDSRNAMDANHLSKSLSTPKQSLIYRHFDHRITVGEKRNMACAASRGEILVMMDDDDIYNSDRIGYQLEPLIKGVADMTVLRQGVWLQIYRGSQQSHFFHAKQRMAESVHYGTLAFRKKLWQPNNGIIFGNGSLLDEVEFYHKVKALPSSRVLELPNNGMHIYVRHPRNINLPGTDLASDRRFLPISRPSKISKDYIDRLELIFASMHEEERSLLSNPKCGACVDVNGLCVSADECWDMYANSPGLVWSKCMGNTDPPCSGCEKSLVEVCEDRCVSTNGPCKTFEECYDMYSDYPEISCDRFPSCNCDLVETSDGSATETTGVKCGACVDVNGPCVSADECWDMYANSPPGLLWSACMENADVTCSGCEKSPAAICEDRCVSTNGPCKTFEECYDMYSDYPEISCHRFPSCDCDLVETPVSNATEIAGVKCGACIDVGGPCVSADKCWDMYANSPALVWSRCMENTGAPCTGCEKSPAPICEDRCVDAGPCKSLEECYDMYSNYPEISCDRFPSCDCNLVETPDTNATKIAGVKCGACVYVGGPCVSADECWDMYANSPALVWSTCMENTYPPCSGCEKSPAEVCEDRCVSTNGPCKSLEECYDMYSEHPENFCDRFPSCECNIDIPVGDDPKNITGETEQKEIPAPSAEDVEDSKEDTSADADPEGTPVPSGAHDEDRLNVDEKLDYSCAFVSRILWTIVHLFGIAIVWLVA